MLSPVTIYPIEIHARSVTVACLRCNHLHQYQASQLKPWPIRPGDKREVIPICYLAELRLAAAGCADSARSLKWGPIGLNSFIIHFTEKEKP